MKSQFQPWQLLLFILPGCRFLPPTMMDGKTVAGLKVGPRTFIAEGENAIEAYHALKAQILG